MSKIKLSYKKKLNSNYSTTNNKRKLKKEKIIKTPYLNDTCEHPTNNINNPNITDCKLMFYSLNGSVIENDVFSTFPEYDAETSIIIPKKVKRLLDKKLTKDKWSKFASNKAVSIEKLLIFISLLPTAIVRKERLFKAIHSDVIQDCMRRNNSNTYMVKSAVQILQELGILEVESHYVEGEYPRGYRLTIEYFESNIVEYKLKCEEAIYSLRMTKTKIVEQTKVENPIVQNLLNLYPKVQYPSDEVIHDFAQKLIREGYSKNRRKLAYIGKNKRDIKKFMYVNEHLKRFHFLILTEKSPTPSDARIYDRFSMMPSWIRKLVKIDGENVVECDFKCLHPNLAIKIYKGNQKFITHQVLAESLNKSVEEVKEQHLIYFNCHFNQMKNNLVHPFYTENEPQMVMNIFIDKKESKPYFYRIVSKKLFRLETELMSRIVEKLNSMGILVIYVYDALYCKESDQEVVKTIMNKIALEMEIYTRVG